jgi:hypothetical protein
MPEKPAASHVTLGSTAGAHRACSHNHVAAVILDDRGLMLASSASRAHAAGEQLFHGIPVGPVGANMLELCEAFAAQGRARPRVMLQSLSPVLNGQQQVARTEMAAEPEEAPISATVVRVSGAASWVVVWLAGC